jgi:phage terminase small subunit
MTLDDFGLSDRQKIFVAEYLKDFSPTNALIRAGYSKQSANGYQNKYVNHPKVKAAINFMVNERMERAIIEGDNILLEINRLALVDPRKAFDKYCSLLPVHQWPDEVAACISSIKVTELKDKEGNVYGELKEVKFWDKVKALDLAMKHLGLNAPKKVELSTTKDEDTQVKFYIPENGRN